MRLLIAGSSLLAGCLFPSLDELTTHATSMDSSDAGDPTLEAYYRFDEGSGAVAKDGSSHGRDGAMIGAATGAWTTGKNGSALVVSSASSTGCIDVPSFPNIAGALTVTAWVRVDKAPLPDLPGFIVAKSFNLNSEGWRMATELAGTNFSFTLGGIGDVGLDQFGSNAPFALGVWTHVAMVFDPEGRDSIYINGALDTTRNSPAAIVASKADLRIGCRGDTAKATYFDGAIDEVRIYSRALSANDIQSLYAQ